MQDDHFRPWELKLYDTCYKGRDDVDISSISSFCPAFLQVGFILAAVFLT